MNVPENLKYTKKDFVIGYTGSLMNGRGIELIIDLAEKLQDYKFFVAGGREFEIEYYNEYKKKKRINNIFFNGFIPNGKIGDYLRKLLISNPITKISQQKRLFQNQLRD